MLGWVVSSCVEAERCWLTVGPARKCTWGDLVVEKVVGWSVAVVRKLS